MTLLTGLDALIAFTEANAAPTVKMTTAISIVIFFDVFMIFLFINY